MSSCGADIVPAGLATAAAAAIVGASLAVSAAAVAYVANVVDAWRKWRR